jgi:hypothetical protein
MKPTRCPERVDQRALGQVTAVAKITGKPIDVKVRLVPAGTTVYEDTCWGLAVKSSLAWGPFSDDAEAHAFCQQRLNWLERSAIPDLAGDKVADPFTFVYPPP